VSRVFRYLTHPQVHIDPAVPVPKWGLSNIGAKRVQVFSQSLCLLYTTKIISSGETKALETASPIAVRLKLEIAVDEMTHENDRSSTGFLPPPEFEIVADQFFASPETSVRGWERAIDAQFRIASAFHRHADSTGDVLMVGHGGVGTLLFCYLSKMPIQRIRDQPPGGGNVWAFDIATQQMLHGWRAMEAA
jgi:broad specificity phosphatase PhoE